MYIRIRSAGVPFPIAAVLVSPMGVPITLVAIHIHLAEVSTSTAAHQANEFDISPHPWCSIATYQYSVTSGHAALEPAWADGPRAAWRSSL